jgi:hypothetical protein
VIRSGRNGYHAGVKRHDSSPATTPCWLVDVEVLALSWRDGRLHHRCMTQTLEAPASPHDTARLMADLDPEDPGALCHSTSWRADGDSRVVLTYAALPDPADRAARPCEPGHIVAAGDAVSPQPQVLHREHVLTHALRHLSMLSREDPTVRKLVPHQPQLWAAIDEAAARAVTAPEDELAG